MINWLVTHKSHMRCKTTLSHIKVWLESNEEADSSGWSADCLSISLQYICYTVHSVRALVAAWQMYCRHWLQKHQTNRLIFMLQEVIYFRLKEHFTHFKLYLHMSWLLYTGIMLYWSSLLLLPAVASSLSPCTDTLRGQWLAESLKWIYVTEMYLWATRKFNREREAQAAALTVQLQWQ